METKIISLPSFHVIGYRIEATVEDFEAGLRQSHYHQLVERKDEIKHRKNDHVLFDTDLSLPCRF